ncbi:Fluoroquinolones export permease protein [Caloramator mitchellensis]|uniref:Fluoroquinolones export permease protein n=1 Tax=Caloramator mitchellensis TaxID=908809 RepID=A0A0R3JWD7_CALMK|nr:hypothetical protein [Caloramator mitchellensis]KRQ87843.1 Fluoroquinolones export permease protein [Caloramator mitchellensis]
MAINRAFVKYSFKIIFRDNILSILIISPIITAFAFKLLIAFANKIISTKFGIQNVLEAYYLLLDVVFVYLSPCFFSIISSLVILEELDENTSQYLMITPLNKRGYLVWRLFIPCFVSFVFSIVLVYSFSLTNFNFFQVVLLSAISVLNALIMSLIIITSSKNKVEGLAWTKLVNINILFIFVPFFFEGLFEKIFAVFPSYWLAIIAKKFENEYFYIYVLFTTIILSLWIKLFYKRFIKKVFY